MIKSYKGILALGAVAALAVGCTDDYNFNPPADTFQVSPQFTGIDEGTTIQLAATSNGAPAAVTWSSDNEAVVRVNASGLVTAVAPGGPVNIIARLGNEAHSSSITVNALQGIALTKGVPVTGLSGAAGNQKLYRIFVPAGTTSLTVTLSGGPGDADIYTRRGTPPTNSSFTGFSFNAGNGEQIVHTNPQSGTWYILVDAFTAYSGATLTATYVP
jgi:hypothetical protein